MSKKNKVFFGDLKRNPIRKQYPNGVVIFNLDKKIKEELIGMLDEYTKSLKDEEVSEMNVNITSMDLLLRFIPKLTNIELPEDESLINEILEDPGEILEEVIEEIGDMISDFYAKLGKKIDKINKMPEKDKKILAKTIKQQEEKVKLTPEEEEKFKKWQEQQNG